MKLEKNHIEGEIILRLNETEYLIIHEALKAASSDITRSGLDYFHFYGAEKGDVVRLHNQINEEERKK